MSVTTVTKTWAEWRLWGQGYAWSTRYTASCVITVTRNTGSDTATVKFDATMTTPSGDSSLGDWQCIPTINGASSGGGEKTFTVASAGYHAENSSYTVSQTYTVGVGVSAGTLTGTIKFRIGGYSGYQGEYSEAQNWSLTYDTKGTPSQATWSNYNWGKASTITIQRTVPDFRESVYLVWQDDTSHPVTIRTYSQSSATSISYTIPYASCPTNAKTRSAKIRVVTYNGSTQIGTWETSAVTVTLLSGDTAYLPTISANPVCEAYNDVVSALGTDTAVAQYSKLNVKADSANVYPKYSATIVSYVVTFSNGSTASGSQLNHISSVIQSAGTVNWTYKVTDSRGYTAEKSGSYTVINSSAPSIGSYTVYRGDSSGNAEDGGAYIYATATATCESLNGHNTVTLQGRVGSGGSYQNMTNGTRKTLMSNADPNTQYVVTLKATDLLRYTTMDFILPSADCPFHIPSGKHGMGIGMKAQASDNTLYVGYDTNFYGDVVKHDAVKNIDIDLVRTTDSLVGGAWTEIPANANLNTDAYLAVGKYFCSANVTVATLTNCPTGNAFYMIVRNVTKTSVDLMSEQQFFVREIVSYLGERFIQSVSHASGGTNTYEAWYQVNTSLASEHGNTAQWLKAHDRRPTSLDFPHIYDSAKVHARLDQSSSSLTGGVNSIFGEGYVMTFMWDTSSKCDTQFYLPDADGNAPAYRCFSPSQNAWGSVKRLVTTEVEKDSYPNTNIKKGAVICRRQGNVVSVNSPYDATSVSANTWVAYVQIGTRYRPSETVYIPVGNAGTAYSRWVRIDTDGWIYLFTSTAVTSAQNFGFSTSYIVD